MPITINNPILSTKIFIALFVFFLLASLRRKKSSEPFPLELTQELKGLAILVVVFSHVGYSLSVDHRFLFPLSIMAGVGVNLFLFLSGYGLAISALKKKLPAVKFYKKRLLKLFAPLWIIVPIFFLLDFFLLHITYPGQYIVRSLLGFFPRADLLLDVDSPLWYFTPVLFYYLIFPLVFLKKRPWLSAIFIYAASYFVLLIKLPISIDVLHLYQLHLLAFPLGIAFSSLFSKPLAFNFQPPIWIKIILDKLKIFKRPAHFIVLIVLLIFIGFTAYYSGVGGDPEREQMISLATMAAIIIFFIMKKFEIKMLYIAGLSAYEIYLIHWPLMSRYDLFFKRLPGWLAMIFYFGFFLILAWALKIILGQIHRIKIPRLNSKTEQAR